MPVLRIGHLLANLGPGTYDIGREPDCAICIDSGLVSRRHARLTVEANGLATLVDLGSRNGTRINGQPLAANVPALIKPGDDVEVGEQRLTLEDESPAATSRRSSRPRLDVRSCPGCGASLDITAVSCACGLKVPTAVRMPSPVGSGTREIPLPSGGVVLLLSRNAGFVGSVAPAFGSNQGVVFGGGAELFDALRQVFPRRPDLLLIDQHLPVPDLEEIARWRATLPGARIGIFGDLEEEAGLALANEVGADVYFRQPMTVTLFVAKVRFFLARARIEAGGTEPQTA